MGYLLWFVYIALCLQQYRVILGTVNNIEEYMGDGGQANC